MKDADQFRFELFANEFVRAYWETVKNNVFPMPPYEPIEETLEELLSNVTHETEMISTHWGPRYKLRMVTSHESWFLITFRKTYRPSWLRRLRGCCGLWVPVSFLAPSLDVENPHELLGLFYGRYFKPFLRHVTKVASKRSH